MPAVRAMFKSPVTKSSSGAACRASSSVAAKDCGPPTGFLAWVLWMWMLKMVMPLMPPRGVGQLRWMTCQRVLLVSLWDNGWMVA